MAQENAERRQKSIRYGHISEKEILVLDYVPERRDLFAWKSMVIITIKSCY